MKSLTSTFAMTATRHAMDARIVLMACAVCLAGPAFADQAQTDLAAALAYNQQVAQQQQTQMQNQQFFYGTAGIQPYCNYYGTC